MDRQVTGANRRGFRGWVSLAMVLGWILIPRVVDAVDNDADGMSDEFEVFFGLSPSNAADANVDLDDDALTNLAEATSWTDPFLADTDADGWKDGVDANPLSRAVIEWGDPAFTTGDSYMYTGPAWWLSAAKSGGLWTNGAWHVPASEPAGLGALVVGLDRTILTSPVVYRVTFFDHAGAALYLALCDSNGVAVATNVSGNLISGTQTDVTRTVSLPLPSHPAASMVKVQRASGDASVFQSMLYVDQDGDGLDADQEAQLGTSDLNADTTPPQIDCSSAFTMGNVAFNAGFEHGGGGGSQVMDGWVRFGNVYQEGFAPRSGALHAKMFGNFVGVHNYSGLFQDHDALPGETWRGVVRVMTAAGDAIAGDNRVFVKLEFFDASMNFIGAVESDDVDAQMPRNVYLPLAVTGVTPANTARIRLTILFAQGPDSAGGSVYLDDARLEKVVGNNTVTCQAQLPEPDADAILAFDNTDPTPTVTFVGDYPGSGSGCPGSELTVSRVWRATDDAGNRADCSVEFTVVDSVLPAIHVAPVPENFLLNSSFEAGAAVGSSGLSNWTGFGQFFMEALTPRTGQRHAKLYSNFTGTENLSGLFQDMVTEPGDAWRLSAYALTDSGDAIRGGNQAFIKFDFLDAAYNGVGQVESFRLGSGMAHDQYIALAVSAVAPTNARYVRAVVLFKGDASNSTGSIYFDDVALERISAQPPPPDYSSVTAADNCDGSVVITLVGDSTNSGSGCSGDPRIVTRTWRATDACGQQAQTQQLFVVEDDRAPLLLAPADKAIDPADSTDPANTGYATMVADAFETATLSYTDQLFSVPLPEDSILERTWTAVDGCGNTAVALQRITLTPDVDGDGIPNAWELQHGLDPENAADAHGDLDSDALQNVEEFLAGTLPANADTDGDGMSDGFELRQAGSDALIADFDGTRVNVLSIPGADAVTNVGSWQTIDDAIETDGYGGSVTYNVQVPYAGHFALEVDAVQVGPTNLLTDKLDVGLTCGGIDVGRQVIVAGTLTSGTATWVLPYLAAGTHQITLDWRFLWKNRTVRFNELRLQTLGGPDTNQNGVADWLDHRRAGMVLPGSMVVTSLVSPACVEGSCLLFDTLSATSSVGGALSVQHGVANRWFVNVPLIPGVGATVNLSGNHGDAVVSPSVVWSVLNVVNPPAPQVTVREGDALLLNAFPQGVIDGTATISIPGVTSVTTSVASPVVQVFGQAGEFVVTGVWSGGSVVTGQVTVRVVSGTFNGSPVAWTDRPRVWSCAGLSPEIKVESDPRLAVTQHALAQTGTQFSIQVDDRADRFIVARVSEGGPILASARVRGMDLFSSSQLYLRITDQYPDGSRRVESGLFQTSIQPDIRVVLNTLTAGVLFEDGTTAKELTAGDFDATGFSALGFVLDAEWDGGVCHRLRIYQGEELVGER